MSRRADLEALAQHFAAIVEWSDDAILSKDLNGTILSWNRAATRMFQYTADEIVGKSIRLLIPDDRQSEEDEVLARIRTGQRVDHFETIRRRKDGTTLPISITVSPILDASGRVVGASKIARDISERQQLERERAEALASAEYHAATTERLNQFGTVVASALDRQTVVQAVTDAATALTSAAFGAFFYNVADESGDSYMLYTISGAPREAFSQFPMPRSTVVFAPTFHGDGPVRSADITADPRYGHNMPHHGMPAGHLPVRSYLAVPVKVRSGEVIGGLFFGHPDTGRFTEQHERLAVGMAAWASVALENSRLYLGLQNANRLKDEFLATLSHELRTPLNTILGYSSMIRTGVIATGTEQKAIAIIERNARSLARLVEDVLDVSRIISGKMRLNLQTVRIADVVQTAIDSLMPAAASKGISVDATIDPNAGAIRGDADRLQQIAWNLMSNAVKFTGRGGRVTVDVRRVDRDVQVTIADTGVGIVPAFLPYLFERFRQAESGSRRPGGLGLGLNITRQLVELHGGAITAASDGEGRGATFRVTLPALAIA